MSAKKFKILITGNLAPYALSFLKNAPSLTVQYEPSLSGPALETAISDADGLIIRTDTKVTKDLLDHAPQLRAICRAGMGVDQIDIASCIQKKITVMNTPEANRVSAAEHTFALLLALAKKIPQANVILKNGGWEQKKLNGIEVAHKTLGIVGLGNIGKRVALRAQAFDMKVITSDPYLEPQAASKINVELMLLKDVLKKSDFVTLHVPLNDETKKMVNENFLSAMKPESFLINASRGLVVDEEVLVQKLSEKKLAGAALDVFENEPLKKGAKLLEFENVIVTPHTAGKTKESQLAMSMDAAAQIRKFFEEGISMNVVLRN